MEENKSKTYKDYSAFKFTPDDIISEAIKRCKKEMYAKSQPSADYDEVMQYYIKCQKEGKEPERIYTRYYLSFEETKYIIDKYIKAYHLEDQFPTHCDIILRDLTEGCRRDKYIPSYVTSDGVEYPAHSGYEDIPPLSKQIGEDAAKIVSDLIKERRNFYRFDRDENIFRTNISLGDSPMTNEQTVKDYWKSKGITLEIDPRHWGEDDFWCEENGYFEDEDCEVGGG